jgi:ABC-type transport system involved in multi-copper enzyme maturation permease subunit
MKNIWLLAQITFKEGIRNRILMGIIFFAIALCVANLIITNMFGYDLGKVAVDVGLSIVSIAGLIIIFFMGINLLSKDLDKKTIYMVLSRPFARWQYILGKFMGLGLLILVSVTILGVFASGSVKLAMLNAPNYIPPDFSWFIFGLALGYTLLSLWITMSLALLFTCATSSPFLAMIITACSYFIGQNVELVGKMYHTAGTDSGSRLFQKLIEVVSWVFPNLSAFDLKTTAAYGLPVNTSQLIWSGFYGICYIGLMLVVAIFIFQRRELT